jgi:hypothetical protein
MNEPLINSQSQAGSHLDKAETYKKLGLLNQVRYELEQAKQLDPYIVQEPRYKRFIEETASRAQAVEALKIPFRIGAGMLFINAALGALFLALILISGGFGDLASGDFIAPIVNLIIGVNLWQLKQQWQKYTVWWAALGLVLFGGLALVSGDYFGLLNQLGFSGALILLFAGTPSKVRTIAAVAVFLVLYLGLICLLFALSVLGMI